MNRLTYFFACLFGVWACHSASSVTPESLTPVQPIACTNVTDPLGAAIENLDTYVTAIMFTDDNGVSHPHYFLDKPDADVPKLYYNACNLPDAYKQDKLHVRINGYKYVLEPNADYIGVPIELTRIEVIPRVN